jgi:hypothetical protein
MKDQLWNYKIARACFYKGQYDTALSIIQNVKPDMAEDGNVFGRQRVRQAAILVEKYKIACSNDKSALLKVAVNNFNIGINIDLDA